MFGLTSIPGKIMEQINLKTISKHIEDKNGIAESQYEFMKGRSRLTILIVFYNEITGLMDEEQEVGAV